MDVRSRVLPCLLLLGLGAANAAAQTRQPALGEALRLERRGAPTQAAVVYKQVLADDPTNTAALLGLERVLRSLNALDSIEPILDSALVVDPRNRFVREVQMRVYSSLGQPERVATVAAAWMHLVPDSPDPFRQWAFVLAQDGNVGEALGILQAGRERLGPRALAAEMAQLHMATGDWRGAAQEWRGAVMENRGNAPSAIAGLTQAPIWEHDAVLQELVGRAADAHINRVGAELLVAWGRAEEGWALLDAALPSDPSVAVVVLRQFANRARTVRTREAARARGFALERLATLTSGEEAKQARLEAAQAFADAGELQAARRMLDRLDRASDRGEDGASAMATLIRVGAESGRLDEAERRFREWEGRLRADDAAMLREKLAWGWVLRNRLDRAERVLQGDSTVNSMAVLGWIAVYRGDLQSAVDRFRVAGPYAQTREEATKRTTTLALIQRIEPDSVPALGAALLQLARRDTAEAIDGLENTAWELPRTGGRADVLAFAGDLAVARGDFSRAEPLLRAALTADAEGAAAPAAEYALAVVLSATGRQEDAVQALEHLIITFPESAVVPQARRLLDRVRGMIPPSRSDGTA